MSDEADDREQAEADALARALADQAGDEPVPDDALEAAALLRYGGRDGELGDDRAQAMLARLLPRVDEVKRSPAVAARPAAAPLRRRRVATALALGLAAAAAAALFLRQSGGERASAPASSPAEVAAHDLPRPSARLLSAQAELTRDAREHDRAAFENEMRAHREQVLRALERAYPARIGRLELGGRR